MRLYHYTFNAWGHRTWLSTYKWYGTVWVLVDTWHWQAARERQATEHA